MRKTILIIEDEIDILETTAALLENQEFAVMQASSGETGIAIAYAQVPDLILCDITMPGMSGYTVRRLLAKNELTATIPVIFLTARASSDDIRKGMELGAEDYITKPFKIPVLVAAIKARLLRADQHKVQAELLIKETKKEVRQRYLKEIPDSLGNSLNAIIANIQFLIEYHYPNRNVDDLMKEAEAGELGEPGQYIFDALKASSRLYSYVWAMLRSMERIQ